MPYDELAPPDIARHVVRAVWSGSEMKSELILPDGCTDILFTPSRRSIRVVGVMSRALDLQAARGDMPPAFGVRFQPWAARAFLGFSAENMRDRNVKLEDVNVSLARKLRFVDSAEAAADFISDHAWRRTFKLAPDARVHELATALEQDPACPVNDLARELRVSDRHVHRLFAEHVGIAPKSFARVMRLREAVRASRSERTLAGIAARAGYADHPHFCRESRALTGFSPRDFLARNPHA